MEVALITDDTVTRDGGSAFTAQLASTRLRLLVAFHGLNARNVPCWIIARKTPEDLIVTGAFLKSDTVLLGKIGRDHAATLQASKSAGKTIFIDIPDPLDANEGLAPLRRAAAFADGVVVPTPELASLVRQWVPETASVAVIPEPYEEPISPVLFQPTGDRPLELLWFGAPRNARFLANYIEDLAELAETRPIKLTVLSGRSPYFDQLIARYPDLPGANFQVTHKDWSPGRQTACLSACDIVLIPGAPDGASQTKSANRLVNSIAAGRLAVASPIPSYLPFSDFATIERSMRVGGKGRWQPTVRTLKTGLPRVRTGSARTSAGILSARCG